MARVSFPFGGEPYSFEIESENLIEVLSPKPCKPLANLDYAIEQALDSPIGMKRLEDLLTSSDRVVIVSDDITRLTPSDRILPPMLKRLNGAGIPDGNICCVMALGTHRYMTAEEMAEKVGRAVYERSKWSITSGATSRPSWIWGNPAGERRLASINWLPKPMW